MYIDYSPRRSGKTTNIVTWMRCNPSRILIVMNEMTKKLMIREYADLKGRIETWDSFKKKSLHSFHREIGIDNVDIILKDKLGVTPTYITWSVE